MGPILRGQSTNKSGENGEELIRLKKWIWRNLNLFFVEHLEGKKPMNLELQPLQVAYRIKEYEIAFGNDQAC